MLFNRKDITTVLPMAIAVTLLLSCNQAPQPQAQQPIGKVHRIVSLSPSITESLFALGLGDRVVGVTSYCTFPQEAQSRGIVGGYTDPSYEAVLSQRPDLVILLKEHSEVAGKLEKLGIPLLKISHHSPQEIMEGMWAIGRRSGLSDADIQRILDPINARMERIHQQTRHLSKQRVLVSVGRNMGTASLKSAFAAGPRTYYQQLIQMAGGINVVPESGADYPMISAEGILTLHPDVILDMATDLKDEEIEAVRQQWQQLPNAPAVSQDRVFIMNADYVTVPGPRFIQLLEDMARMLHPSIKLEGV